MSSDKQAGRAFGSFRLDDLREVLLHGIVETAAHAGRLDAARELRDGRHRMVLTDQALPGGPSRDRGAGNPCSDEFVASYPPELARM